MKKDYKKIVLLLAFILLFSGLWQNCWAQTETELIIENYPELGGISPQDLDPDRALPQLIKYVFLFALGAVGFVALLSLMIAAVQYVTSAGNAARATAAKERIMSALLGMGLLLASVLLLRTINPDLISLEVDVNKMAPFEENVNTDCEYEGKFSDSAIEEDDIRNNEVVTLTLTRTNCLNAAATHEIDSYLKIRQYDPGITQKDNNCTDEIEDHPQTTVTENTDTTWKKDFLFRCIGSCRKKAAEKDWQVCNEVKDDPETFYIEGKIKWEEGGKEFELPIHRINLRVKDYR